MYDAYSQLRDSEIDPRKLQAFHVLTGTTPEQFAKTALHGADQCMMAVLNDLGVDLLSGEWVNADRDCVDNHRLLHGSPKNP
jgi:hypothetical protein